MEIVSAIRQRLADKVGKERFELWFGHNVSLAFQANVLSVVARNDFWLDRLRTHFRRDLELACFEVVGQPPQLKFVSRGAEKPQPRKTTRRRSAADPNQKTTDSSSLGAERGLTSYVIGECNKLAHMSAATALSRLGRWSPLFIHGPHGSGKTELLKCLKNSARDNLNATRVVMMSAEQFTTFFLEALHGSGLPNFRRKYRDLDLLIIDDVQFLAGKPATLVELHHTIDSIQRNGRQLVFASDRPALELSGLGQELIGRMTGGLTCAMESLDEATRRSIFRAQAAQRGLKIPATVVDEVASQICGDGRQVIGALNRLEAVSIAQQSPITDELASECLHDIFRSQRKAVRMDDIEGAVCEVFGLDRRTLQSDRKTRSILQPRMLAMWLARKHTRAAYSEIGRYFGKRSHSTVISAQQKVTRWMSENAAVQLPNGECGVQAALHRIESQLRTGG
jgi:chromosomal replication initiator protein